MACYRAMDPVLFPCRSAFSHSPTNMTLPISIVVASVALALSLPAAAQDAEIRKTLAERVPGMNKIDEISPTSVPGLFEVRIGTDLFYADATGNHLIKGELIDTKARRSLTKERLDKITAVDFASLPLQDAIVIVRGDGQRKLAVFEDPNCGYCKRLERDLQNVNNVTVYLFLYPILGADSVQKARSIWCAQDKARAWESAMLKDQVPSAATCDSAAIDRNLAFGRQYRIAGTPTVIFADGVRGRGAMSLQQIEQGLSLAGSRAAQAH